MTRLLIIILIIISNTIVAQLSDCRCFNDVSYSESGKPILTVEFSNGTVLSICGDVQKKLSENEFQISELNVFNCNTGEILIEYTPTQTCIVQNNETGLNIVTLKFLPAGENWSWIYVEIGLQQIFIKENKLVVLEQKPI